MLKNRKPIKPGKPLKCGKGLKRTGKLNSTSKLHPKAKPKTRKARLAAETEKRCMAVYRNQRCIICAFENTISTSRTYGHHIVPKSRSRAGRHDPANIVPVCATHHKTGNDCCPHSSNPLAAAHFDRWLERWMPKRFAETRELDKRAKQGPPYTITEVEQDHTLWEAISRNGLEYVFICETAGIEAYAEGE